MLVYRLLIALLKTFFSLKKNLLVGNSGVSAFDNTTAVHFSDFLCLTATEIIGRLELLRE